ncbi:REP-associated tyrosine transposase [Celerinatantimonas sp. MCCC 1A17872]|uniref:REP-associated tyrosine transposase n=1 Tax=Celerinatantimonas sp. MCCC 1A17872 TaxID=3177514 RepID=UPI0038BFD85E
MVNYRRVFIPGGCYFFTLTLKDRRLKLLTEQIDLLRDAFHYALARYPCHIQAISVMPDHIHLLVQLPNDTTYFPKLIQSIKSRFSLLIHQHVGKNHKSIWQSRYWEHCIRDERDWLMHINYIHRNPYKHHLVKFVKDWPYSSFHQYVQRGILTDSWQGEELDGYFGE